MSAASYTLIGLMSGTSCDGVDAALVEVTPDADGLKPLSPGRFGLRTLDSLSMPYEPDFRQRLLHLSQPEDTTAAQLCQVNFLLGELFATAVELLLEKAGYAVENLLAIGSHGHTVCHLPAPPRSKSIGSTLQIGEADVIAARTGVTTVSDFRPRDLALGGQGAPLAPFLDYLVFSSLSKTRCIVNIGGISNVTLLPAGTNERNLLAFDAGPGNMLIDGLVRSLSGGRCFYDQDGEMAAKGRVNKYLLDWLNRHPFLKKSPPKSTGREEFGAPFVAKVLAEGQALGLSDEDLLASATAFTAQCIASAARSLTNEGGQLDEVVVSGGGIHNQTLISMLRQRLHPTPVASSAEYGIDPDAKEAVLMALLAYQTLAGGPGNMPAATGAKRQTVLGKISPGEGRPAVR